MKSLCLAGLALMSSGCIANSTFYAPELTRCQDSFRLAPRTLRVASYNLKAGLESSLEAVGDELARIDADVVALQEVDVGVERSNHVDQAQVLAERLGMQPIFAAAIARGGGAYGIAVLTRLPVQSAQRIELNAFPIYEPRVAIDTELCVGQQPLRFVSVHADFLNPTANLSTLADHVEPYVGSGLVVAGDFNALPHESGPMKLVKKGLIDLFRLDRRFTFWPSKRRIDFLLTDSPLAPLVHRREVIETRASDHYPIWADLSMPQLAAPAQVDAARSGLGITGAAAP